ncbi:TetR/AcrR family transcriptional regulator [Streptomyces caatingaensis]|uniref:TetR family transcriptional regulator n=1 Tax=Streptomyces caatingaensis TaxID=1678637 RepID=A0A0K9X8L1_9ACTN|nr:TetR/AcrR family transcriptional regulator [Streptomyces caatingaensis]KNB49760.1 TetR family transcriptional regulator [Streptomyces caatingaensis]
MGRTKQFDPDAALRSALELFWRKGYEATSLQDLVDHLGVNRGSIYATFGSKHALYLRALDRYCETKGDVAMGVLSRPGSALSAVRDLIRLYAAESLDDPDRKGCLVTNTAVELGPHDPRAGRRVEAALTELETSLAGALVRAREQGELGEGADPRALARFLVTFLQGLRVVGKTADARRRLDDAVESALALLR